MIVMTTNDLSGYGIAKYLGVVRGLSVRSRSVADTIGPGIQSLFGGNISLFTDRTEQARREAYDPMVRHAAEFGANAAIAMRYDANEITDGITEVLAYCTAVVVENAPSS